MKQDLSSNVWISAENHSAEINPKAYREEVSLIHSPKTLFESINLIKSYDKTNLTFFSKSMGKIQVGLNFFWAVY